MRPKIYLFGDSITEQAFDDGGWGSSLANHFSRTADVVLRGYSGYNTRWALKVIEEVFPPATVNDGAPLAVTVFFGANDACLPDRYGALQHVPLPEYKENLLTIFAILKKRWPSTLIIFITPPPIDEAARILHPYVDNPTGLPERTNEAAGNYAQQCLAAAAECGIPALDLWTKMQQFPDWQNVFLNDGLHLTRHGNKAVFEELIALLREHNLSLETLPADLPLFGEMDPNEPLKSFEKWK